MESKKTYDFLIVGAGLYGAVCARELADAGFGVLVIDRRDTIGGNCYTGEENGVVVHKYGPHIFHTDDEDVWRYVAEKVQIQPAPDYTPIAVSQGEAFNLPFNMNTFAQLFKIFSPTEAKERIEAERKAVKGTPRNLEEQAISLVGTTVFERLIKGYTEKQWGKKCSELPPEIIKRLPVRFTYDNTYYNDRFIGIPACGWTPLFERLLEGVEVRLGVDYLKEREKYAEVAKHTIYTGPIDEFFGYKLGRLEYRSLRFETLYFRGDHQGCAVMNWTDRNIRYTRSIEHMHFDRTGKKYESSVITLEYPIPYKDGNEPYYPIVDERNAALYESYKELAKEDATLHFGGRLGLFQYLDMDDTIVKAKEMVKELLEKLT
ncbi:MAG: UDP-galactopyranose mutase [Prevotella sp.]|nr:UDP-galactopyranose mutase [Prevotella sp.]